MGKLLTDLERQLSTEFKQDAENCIKVYNKLKEINEGKVWGTQWEVLTKCNFIGNYPNSKRIYKLSEIGNIFFKGI